MAFDYSKGVQISLRSFRFYLVTNIKRLRYSFLIHVGYRILSIVNIMRDLELNVLINRRTFKGDGIITTNFLPQDYDRNLLHAFEGSFRNLPKNQLRLTSIIWRAHIVTACAHFVRNIDGDFIELGVIGEFWHILLLNSQHYSSAGNFILWMHLECQVSRWREGTRLAVTRKIYTKI